MTIDLDLIGLAIFATLVLTYLYTKKSRVEIRFPLIIQYSKSSLRFMDHFVKKHEKILRIVGSFGIVIGFVFSFLGMWFIITSIIEQTQQLAIVLPTVGKYRYPGPVISVPFWYWLIAIFVIAFPHETMHAVYLRLSKVRVKRYGIIYLLFIPISAFVDPNQKEFDRLNFWNKLRVLAAGSFINAFTAFIVFVSIFLLIQTFSNLYEAVGVAYEGLVEKSPAYQVNLSGIIQSIDGKKIKGISDLSNVLSDYKPGDIVNIETTEGIYELKLGEKDGYLFIGISYPYTCFVRRGDDTCIKRVYIVWFSKFLLLLQWIFILSLGVAVGNMLPMKPLDGGLMYEEIFKKLVGKKRGKKIANIFSIVVFVLLLLALFLPRFTF